MLLRKPRKGDRIGFGTIGPDGSVVPAEVATATVCEVKDDDVVWCTQDAGSDTCFIWQFRTEDGDMERNKVATIFPTVNL